MAAGGEGNGSGGSGGGGDWGSGAREFAGESEAYSIEARDVPFLLQKGDCASKVEYPRLFGRQRRDAEDFMCKAEDVVGPDNIIAEIR